jgi:integrase
VEQARTLLSKIDVSHVVGLRDRAVLATLVYTGARVGAVAKLCVQDFYQDGNQWYLHLDEKGGKARQIPVRHDLQTFYEKYIAAAGLSDAPEDSPLFRSTVRKLKVLTDNAMTDNDILRMVKRRLKDAKLPTKKFSCHSFRATTITDLLEQGVNTPISLRDTSANRTHRVGTIQPGYMI